MFCDCIVCQDVVGVHTGATRWQTATRWFRKFNRSFLGELAKFCVTLLVAILVGYYAVKSQIDGLKTQVADLQIQTTALSTQTATLQTSVDGAQAKLNTAQTTISNLQDHLRLLGITANETTAKLSLIDFPTLEQHAINITSILTALNNQTTSTSAQLYSAALQLSTFNTTTQLQLSSLVSSALAQLNEFNISARQQLIALTSAARDNLTSYIDVAPAIVSSLLQRHNQSLQMQLNVTTVSIMNLTTNAVQTIQTQVSQVASRVEGFSTSLAGNSFQGDGMLDRAGAVVLSAHAYCGTLTPGQGHFILLLNGLGANAGLSCSAACTSAPNNPKWPSGTCGGQQATCVSGFEPISLIPGRVQYQYGGGCAANSVQNGGALACCCKMPCQTPIVFVP